VKAKGKKFISWLLVLSLFSFSPLILAQDKKEEEYNQNEPYFIQRINGQVELDGLSNDPAWQNIKPLPLTIHVPNFRGQPTEKTEILVGYDNDYLYVAGRLYDSEPEKIQFPSKKRDDMKLNNDWFGLVIDTFNDNENALAFFATPSGLRLDMTVFGDGQGDFPVNQNWNTFWDVKTKRNEEGWFAEFRIPLSSLRFQDQDGRTVMGLITSRYIARKNEWIVFPAIPPNWGFWSPFKPSQAQEVVFENLYSRKPLYIAPYLLGGFGRSFDLDDLETAYIRTDDPIHEIGLDVKCGLTSNLTLDVTLNTDFAQVEADDQQVNLTRFSLFFPEKRLFFQERSSTFDFNFGGDNMLFYSRRIGIYEEEEVPIYGGVRLVGREGSWDLGFLSLQTAPIEDLPSENFGVLRIRRRIFNPYSYVGGIVTSRIGVDGSYNVAYGVDGIFRVFRDDYLIFNFAQTFENERENNPLSLNPARLRINWERRTIKGLGYDLSFSRVGEDYNPGIGFEMREDYSRIEDRLLYGWIPGEESWLLRHYVFLDGSVYFNNKDNSIQSAEIGPGWDFEAKTGFSMSIAAKLYHENVDEGFSFDDEAEVPAGQYTFYGLTGSLQAPPGRLFETNANFNIGSFYDGWRVSLDWQPRWSVSSELELSGFYQFNWIDFSDRDQKFIAHIVRLRALAMLSTKFSAAAFIQYNSAADAVVANIRIRFNPREGNDLYIVYNEALNTNRYREIPTLPFTSSRAIMLKYTYTFNIR
jgi:hypothetical protein